MSTHRVADVCPEARAIECADKTQTLLDRIAYWCESSDKSAKSLNQIWHAETINMATMHSCYKVLGWVTDEVCDNLSVEAAELPLMQDCARTKPIRSIASHITNQVKYLPGGKVKI